jgi:hypothetical protein
VRASSIRNTALCDITLDRYPILDSRRVLAGYADASGGDAF